MSKEALSLARLLFAAAAIAVAGCGGGGGGSSASPAPAPPGAPAIQVLPSSFDFGQVTTNNVPAPLEVTIRNTGTAALNVSAISLLAPSGSPFGLTLNAGTKPCGLGSQRRSRGFLHRTGQVSAADRRTVHLNAADHFERSGIADGHRPDLRNVGGRDFANPAHQPVRVLVSPHAQRLPTFRSSIRAAFRCWG